MYYSPNAAITCHVMYLRSCSLYTLNVPYLPRHIANATSFSYGIYLATVLWYVLCHMYCFRFLVNILFDSERDVSKNRMQEKGNRRNVLFWTNTVYYRMCYT